MATPTPATAPVRLGVALGQLYERWDGRGMPNGLRGHVEVLA